MNSPLSADLATARIKVAQIAGQIAMIDREMIAIRAAFRISQTYDASRFNSLDCKRASLYRSLRGAKGAVTRLQNRGA